MKNFNVIISALLRQKWLIEPGAAEALLPLIDDFLIGKSVSWDKDEQSEEEGVEKFCAFIGPDGSSISTNDLNEVPNGSIAILSVNGPLMKDDWCGDPGMDTMSEILQDWENSGNIAGVIIRANSPGGSVAGTESLGNTIAGMSKPNLTFVDGMAASGMYWLASQSDHIMASGETSEVGSIGVMTSLVDRRKMLENAGVTEHIINADTSPDKNKAYLDARDGKYGLVKEGLNATHKVFQKTVKTKRPEIDDSTLTGKMYPAKKAKKLGMIDSIGNFQDAVSLVKQMAEAQQSSSTNKNDMKIFSFKKKTAESVALSSEKEEVEAEGVQARIDKLQEDYNALAEAGRLTAETRDTHLASLTSLQAEVNEAKGAHATVKEAIASKNELISAQAAEIAELKKGPAARPTIGQKVPEGTDAVEGGDKKAEHPYYNPNAAHNKTAEEYGIGKKVEAV